eukprot:519678-Hanusia_phi.AAC.2
MARSAMLGAAPPCPFRQCRTINRHPGELEGEEKGEKEGLERGTANGGSGEGEKGGIEVVEQRGKEVSTSRGDPSQAKRHQETSLHPPSPLLLPAPPPSCSFPTLSSTRASAHSRETQAHCRM